MKKRSLESNAYKRHSDVKIAKQHINKTVVDQIDDYGKNDSVTNLVEASQSHSKVHQITPLERFISEAIQIQKEQ